MLLGSIGAFTTVSLAYYHLITAEDKDDELFLMEEEARQYWLEGGIGYCGEAMRPDINLIKAEALNGNATAAFRLGQVYARGTWGEKHDDAEALKWFRMAAEGGMSDAMVQVGLAYEFGKGVALDFREAIRWYQRAYDDRMGGDTLLLKKIELLKSKLGE
jgi:TPR repeat protein